MSRSSEIPAGWSAFGHESAVALLNGSLSSGRVAHAYLFTGPKGVGKRTLAIDLSKALNCAPVRFIENQTEAEARPCGVCSSCSRIARSIHPDVRSISTSTPTSKDSDSETAKRRMMIGIDLISDIQNDAQLKPYEGKSKVFIIEDAEKLSIEASNSLLKILEEPPPSVHFLLTAESHRNLPETIVSRCHRIRLRTVPTLTIEAELMLRYELDTNRARRLARLSMGAPGWAIDAVQDPTMEEARSMAASRIVEIINADLEARFRYAYEIASEFRRERSIALEELDRWIELFRDVSFAKRQMESKVIFSENIDAIKTVAGSLTERQISNTFDSIMKTRQAIQSNALPQLALEVMMLDLPEVSRQT